MGVICKYKYDSSIYADLIPEFNSGYSGYTITDEVEGNITTRTIESDELPTLMRFGRIWVDGESAVDNRTDSLLEVLDMNTSGLTSCNSMFRYNKNLISISCEWDTSNVANMHDMFLNCYKLTSLDVSNFNTSNVTDMQGMFNNCYKLTSLDVSNFNTSKVTYMAYMFYGCKNLTSLDVSNFNTSKVTTMYAMFYDCNNLASLDVSNWDTSSTTNMNGMFYNCNNLTTLDVSNWNTSKVTNMQQMFHSCNNLTSLDVSNWNTNKVTNMQSMFNNCNNLTTLDVSNFDTSNVESMYQIFQDCSNLTSLDVSGFNTVKVIHMGSMFYNCSNLTSLDVSGFDTSNATYMHYMFTYCSKLTNLDLSVFDTSNVTRMEFMFYNCLSLTSLDVSSFNTSKVSDTASMFANTNSLEVIAMFNSDINTINTVGNLTSATLYVDESLDQSQYTGIAPLKVYKEEKLEIKLNSPLLEGDTIEVVDGKLCHVHRMDKMVLDGSEDWFTTDASTSKLYIYSSESLPKDNYYNRKGYSEKYKIIIGSQWAIKDDTQLAFHGSETYCNYLYIGTTKNKEEFKQWLSKNPITLVYQIKIPYYEDITPLQSSLVLKTFLESSMTIDTILPIETKLSYRTNVPSISTLSTRATELAESDNVIHNLMNIIDDEVDE